MAAVAAAEEKELPVPVAATEAIDAYPARSRTTADDAEGDALAAAVVVVVVAAAPPPTEFK